MLEYQCETWKSFESKLGGYFKKRPLDRDGYAFRGHANAEWPLSTTLDRYMAQNGIKDREVARERLLETFHDQALGLAAMPKLEEVALPLIARHHGLPSTIMDWTLSPYVAAFFAFCDKVHDSVPKPEKVAIWCLSLQEANTPFGDNVVVVDDRDARSHTPRAVEQRSVFIDLRHPFDMLDLPAKVLFKFVIPVSERLMTLTRLEGMGLNERSLFRSLDGAAEFASRRVRAMLKEEP